MRSNKWLKVYGLLLGIFLMFNAVTIYGQQQGQITDVTDDPIQNQKSVFKLEVAIIENVKGKISDKNFTEIKKLKDHEFSEQQLPVTLTGLGFNADEIETVLNYVREHLKFVGNVKKLAPIILSMDTVKSNIRKKEAELKSIQSDDRKKEISDKLKELRPRLKELEQKFTNIYGKGLYRNKSDLISAILKDAYKKKQIGTIAGYFKEPVFKMEKAIIENLEGNLSDEKFDEIENLKDREFSEQLLSVSLIGAAFDKSEIETVLNYVQEHLNFVETVKKAAPTAMLMHNIKDDIQKKKAELESASQKKQKRKASNELKKLLSRLKKHEQTFSKIIASTDCTRKELVSDILEASGHEGDEAEIISDYLLKEALFTKTISTLREMVQSIDKIKGEIKEYEGKQKKAVTEMEKKNISDYLIELNNRLKKTKNDFSIITTDIDYNTFLKKEGKEINWEKVLKEIFSPIILELQESTERPRKMERLRSDILYYKKRIPQIKEASVALDKFLIKVTDIKVRARLNIWKEYWSQLEKEFVTQKKAAQHQLMEEERSRKSLWKSFQIFFDSFIKNRGKNIFFAVLAFFAIYMILRLLQRLIWKFSPIHQSSKYMFWANLADVLFMVFTLFTAACALLIVLYTSGDWLIMAIVIFIVLGILWGARNTIPQFAEQIKLLLGFGPVRQGERVIIDGIPWRVEMMGVYSYLKNPLLTSGTIRLPLKDLIGMRSRSYDENEPWFPCKEDDCVLINDKTWRHVVLQTPQVVKFEWYEMYETMPTSTFISQKIFNLSEAPFWTGFGFEISYKHRFEVFEICQKLTDMTKEEVKKTPWSDFVIEPWIDFENFGDSSLVITYWIQMKKEAASKYPIVKRELRKIALKAANKYDLEIIQFTNVNLHQPDEVQGLLEDKAPS